MKKIYPVIGALSLGAALVAGGGTRVVASSHREAPFITTSPKVDAADFYMFRSYEGVAANGSGGRSDYVTMIANYQPLQHPYGGPNYFEMDPNALYEIHIDNNGDAKEDLTFQFRFQTEIRLPGVFTGFVGNLAGIPPITALDGPGSTGLSLRQKF